LYPCRVRDYNNPLGIVMVFQKLMNKQITKYTNKQKLQD